MRSCCSLLASMFRSIASKCRYSGSASGKKLGTSITKLSMAMSPAWISGGKSMLFSESIDFPPDIHAGDIAIDNFVIDVPSFFPEAEPEYLHFDAIDLNIDASSEQQDLIRQAFGVVELAPHH